jgi:hypothetical protein
VAYDRSAEQTAAAFGPASEPAIIRDGSPWPSSHIQPRITHTPPARTQHSTTRPHRSHPATQHTGRGKTHALQSDNYAISTVWLWH